METPETQSVSDDIPDTFDPIEAGLLDQRGASMLLEEFRNVCSWSFPFVIIPEATNVDDLRHRRPFLFHALMTTMTYKTPAIQRVLAEELRAQIASRIITHSHKTLEILQGLLVHAAWYHFFFRAYNQQLAIILQLCVAMIQDLGLSRNPKEKSRNLTLSEHHTGMPFKTQRSADEKRAFLGTFYLVSAFAHAWRKRATMTHTKFMAQCCHSLAERHEVPTDGMITPLVQLGELMCRINEYYSYDDIENAEIRGELFLDMSTKSFRCELERMKDAIPEALQQNTTLSLQFRLLDLWIHECSLHSFLWNSSDQKSPLQISQLRIKMLSHCVQNIKGYLNTLLDCQQTALYPLAFPAWSGWFYAIIVVCKLVFLQDNERQGKTTMSSVPQELSSLLPGHFGPGAPHDFCALPAEDQPTSPWDPVSVAKETQIRELFEKFIDKLEFTFPYDAFEFATPDDATAEKEKEDRDPLFSIAWLQRSLLYGFSKKMKEYTTRTASKPTANPVISPSSNPSLQPNPSFAPAPAPAPSSSSQPGSYLLEQMRSHPIPLIQSLHFNTMNFDSVALPMAPMLQEDAFDDWMWDSMMEDFSFPNL
ncbi:uncharacterized protein BDR25DRAFT_279503 [Lindgomyces ingoldianus]|uniref:Uncharacterized protein n=1 Tax=Lindgomyces ingoldianus TaxID=673940 RepID=A0ACB6R8S2_9PLEO|nr:uncharacterized protein BDR25DRAFT_279503 [Lindgomyces ingoldianus]KAF2475440.1 hypothetical protein BDR25DRAFT_279503 [Lindgomyces ingoldianus]